MFVFPSFLSSATITVIGILLPYIVLPIVLIISVIWIVRKLNSMDEAIKELLKITKNKE